MRRPLASAVLILTLLLPVTAACGGRDEEPQATTTTTTTPATTTGDPSTTLPSDAALAELTLEAADLPAGFADSPDVDDTITAFCANEDAAAGLQATAREVRGFSRAGGGASVIQLVFRFRDGDAARFVGQAGEILDRCSAVPDSTGLAFEYEALTPGVDTAIVEASDASVSRHGTSVGSGNLTIDLVVFQHGDIAQLVAVLGLDLARADLDAVAEAAFEAVADKI